jgi:hypothetical protein
MRRMTAFTVAMAVTVASFCVLARWIEPAANAGVARAASIDVIELHLKAKIADLPVLVVEGLI